MLQTFREEKLNIDTEINLLKEKAKTIEEEIERKEKDKKELEKKINDFYKRLNEINARDKEIYVEKVLLGWSNNRISAKHYGMTRQQILRIVNKIEEQFKKMK